MPVTVDRSAPYAPASAVLDLIQRRRNRGLAAPINADVLQRAGVSNSLVPRTLQALQTLDLIDESGAPTEIFEAIRLAPESEYKRRLEEWLRAAYAEVFLFVDPMVDDATNIRDAFRSYEPQGQQNRMVTLFEGLCRAAGLMPEATTAAKTTRVSPARPTTRKSSSPAPAKTASLTGAARGLPLPLSGLLAGLPAEGEGWTKDARQKFLTTFEHVLDFCYPVVKDDPKKGTVTFP